MKDSHPFPQEGNDENELETPPVQIADNSEVRAIRDVNIPRPEMNPTMKVQS
jgi:hypothetical protein